MRGYKKYDKVGQALYRGFNSDLEGEEVQSLIQTLYQILNLSTFFCFCVKSVLLPSHLVCLCQNISHCDSATKLLAE